MRQLCSNQVQRLRRRAGDGVRKVLCRNPLPETMVLSHGGMLYLTCE